MNESTALASSMNLLDSSFNNSSEFCIRVDKWADEELYNQLAEYVKRIRRRAKKLNSSAGLEKSTPAKVAAKSVPPPLSAPKAVAAGATGHCIRCGAGIPFNPEKPLCAKDYKIWNRHQNPDYEENYCLLCGEKHPTSMAKPLCRRCWRASMQA